MCAKAYKKIQKVWAKVKKSKSKTLMKKFRAKARAVAKKLKCSWKFEAEDLEDVELPMASDSPACRAIKNEASGKKKTIIRDKTKTQTEKMRLVEQLKKVYGAKLKKGNCSPGFV